MTTGSGRRDSLTGALTRDDFAARLDARVAAARRNDRPLSLCVIDLDHFKSINDAFGHARGDQALAEVASRLLAGLRSGDLLFRYGGDEFVLLLPGMDEAQAAALAARLLDRVQAQPLAGVPPIKVSLSIGVAALDANESPRALFERADARAFAAKRLGRGRVIAAEDRVARHLHFDAGDRLLEREMALRQIHAFLAAAHEAGRGLLTIAGPRGAGRSRLAQEAARAAALRGYSVIELRGRPELRSRLYGALLDAAPARAALAHTADPRAVAAALRGQATGDGRRGLFLGVDDLEEVDASTAAVLASLVHGPSPVPVALALVQEGYGAPRGAFEADVTATITATAFSGAATGIWLRAALGAEPPEALVTWLQEQTGGLPGRLRPLLTYLVDAGHLAVDDGAWVLRSVPAQGTLAAPAAAPGGMRLPRYADTFVGRVLEIQQLKDVLGEASLVTLVGPGGMGKTRLAVQAATELAARYPGGAAFAHLTGLREAEHVVAALVATLDIRCGPGEDARAALLKHLACRRLLLVLDGIDERTDRSVLVELRAIAGMALLATAHQPLRLAGEVTLRLAGLPTSRDDGALDGAEAALLFLQRARAVMPEWRPAPGDAPAIGAICRAVDGMPLGLEMAAAWLPALGIDELAAMLTRGADVPAAPADAALSGALDAFWGELGEEEQRVLHGIAVFAGGFTAEAAATIAGASRFLLAALVDRAFLRRGEQGRYSIHELLRRYAAGHAARWPEAWACLRDRHLAYYLALAERASERLHGPEQRAGLAELAAEQDNLRAALQWGIERAHERASGLRLAVALRRFWLLRGALAEGRAWLARALACHEAPDALRASGLSGAATLAHFAGDLAEAVRLLEESVALYRSLGDERGLAHALNNLGMVRHAQGTDRAALALYEEGLALLERLDDARGMAATLSNMGLVAWKGGDLDRAMALFERCLAIERGLGDAAAIADSLDNLGALHGLRGDPARAAALFEEALAAHRELADRRGVARSLANLAELAFRAGAIAEAGARYQESLRLCREIGSARGMIARIEGLALVAAEQGESVRAVTLLGAARRWRAEIGAALTGEDRHAQERAASRLQGALGDAAYAAALEAGRALCADYAVALALQP